MRGLQYLESVIPPSRWFIGGVCHVGYKVGDASRTDSLYHSACERNFNHLSSRVLATLDFTVRVEDVAHSTSSVDISSGQCNGYRHACKKYCIEQ